MSTFNSTFSVSVLFVEQVCTIDPRPSFQTIDALLYMRKVAENTLSTEELASSTRNGNANAERQATAAKVTGQATGIRNISTLPCLPSLFQMLMKDHQGLDFLPSLYAKLLSLLAAPYASVPQKLWMT